MSCKRNISYILTAFSSFLFPALLAAQSNPPVPPSYSDLYASLNSYLQSFASTISSGWNGSPSPVAFSAQLSSSNSGAGPKLISSSYYANAVLPELNELKALGVKAVSIPINYPILSPDFYANPSDYQAYLNFYVQVANDVRARGLKLIVESGPTLTTLGDSWNIMPFYAKLSQAQYQAGRSQQAATIAQLIRPDFFSVLSEPDTEASQTGYASINTVSGGTAFLSQILAAIQQTGNTSMMVGAGVGSWMPSYQSWLQSFGATNIQYFEIHVYPVNRTFLTQLPDMADYAASLGKPIASTQAWMSKERDSELGVLSYGEVSGRDPFSFWAPLDTAFLQNMVNFAQWKHALFVSAFWTTYLHSYVDYNSTIGMTSSQIRTLSSNVSSQAINLAQFSPTAVAYGKAISQANSTPPSVPAGLVVTTSTTAAHLTWTASTDAIGVAGYTVYRNGIAVATLPGTSFFDQNLTPSTPYTYTVSAYDGTLFGSTQSTPVVATTVKVH